jgi:hypothetical protein
VRNRRHMPARSEVGDDTPLRLAVAAVLAYPDGSMTASGLRREAARGRLVIERTAGKDYTTIAAIEEMRKLCRVENWGHGCGSNLPTRAETDMSSRRSGASSMDDGNKAQAIALRIVEKLRTSGCKKLSDSTLASGRGRRGRATVIRLKSSWQT